MAKTVEELAINLPLSRAEVAAATASLSSKRRNKYAALLVVNHSRNPRLRILAKSLLETSLLETEIPVQLSGLTAKEDDDEWDVVENSASVKLLFPQTNACKNLHLRVIGIIIAISLKDKALLESIVSHHSQTLKDRAQKVLDEINTPPKDVEIIEPLDEFTPFFEAIKASKISNREEVWNSYGDSKKWSIKSWTNGMLSSISHPLRNQVAGVLLKMAKDFQPMVSKPMSNGSSDFVAVLPKLVAKNFKDLLAYDASKTLALFNFTFSDFASALANLDLVFSNDIRLWRNPDVDVTLLGKIFNTLQLTDASGSLKLDKNALQTILRGNSSMSIISFLKNESFLVGKKIINRNIELLSRYPQKSSDRETELSNLFDYICEIINHVYRRFESAARVESKAVNQKYMGDYIKETADALIQLFDIYSTKTQALTVKFSPKKLNSQEISWIYQKLYSSCKKELALYLFEKARNRINFQTESGCQLLSWTIAALKLEEVKISDFPGVQTIAPYSGLKNDWSDAGVFKTLVDNYSLTNLAIIEKISLPDYGDVWHVISQLSQKTRSDFRKNYTVHVLEQWMKKFGNFLRVKEVFKMFYDGFSLEVSEIAWTLLGIVAKWDHITANQLNELKAELLEFLDIRTPKVREYLLQNIQSSANIQRFQAFDAFLLCASNSQSLEVDIETLDIVSTLFKNEMRLNVDQIFEKVQTHLNHDSFSRFALATQDQMEKIVLIFSKLQSENLAAISPSPQISKFVKTLAFLGISRFIANPEHIFFKFGVNYFWRQAVHHSGLNANVTVRLPLKNPFRKGSDYLELFFRKSETRGLEILKEIRPDISTLKNPFGLYMIPEGEEDVIVSQIIKIISVKFANLETEHEFIETNCAHLLFLKLRSALCLRWSKVPALINYFNFCINTLENANILVIGTDDILDWNNSKCRKSIEFVKQSCDSAPLDPYYKRFSDLRMQSTEAIDEATRRFKNIQVTNYVERESVILDMFKRSPIGSALHLDFVFQFCLKSRPDLIQFSHLSEDKAFMGLFNQKNDKLRLKFRIGDQKNIQHLSSRLLLHSQSEQLKKRFIIEAQNKSLSMNARVEATSKLMKLKNVSVFEFATFLVSSSLPTRVKESVLMHLPNIDEPASAINLLVSPVFLESNLARTTIFAVRNTIKRMTDLEIAPILRELVPTSKMTTKVTVFKEIVRIVSDYVHIPGVIKILQEVWSRENLNKDVRISLLQKCLELLAHENPEIQSTAWEIVSGIACAPEYKGRQDEFENVGMVLVLVKQEMRECIKGSSNEFMSFPEFKTKVHEGETNSCEEDYLFGNLSLTLIRGGVFERYASDVLAPFVASMYDRVNSMETANDKYVEMSNRLKHALKVLLEFNFITSKNAAKVSSVIRTIFMKSVNDGNIKVDQRYVFVSLASIMGYCAGAQASNENYENVPECWEILKEAIHILTSKKSERVFSVESDAAAKKFADLQIESFFLWGSSVVSWAFKEAAMDLCEAIESVSPKIAQAHAHIRLARGINLRLKHLEWYKNQNHHSIKDKTFNIVANLSQNLLRDIVVYGHSFASLGKPEYEYDKFIQLVFDSVLGCENLAEFVPGLEAIYLSDTWCIDVDGYKSFKNQFRFTLLTSIPNFCNGERLSEFVNDFIDKEIPGFEKIASNVAQTVVKVLSSLCVAQKNYLDWQKAKEMQVLSISNAEPLFDAKGLKQLMIVLKKAGTKSESLAWNSNSPVFLVFCEAVKAEISLMFEYCPDATAKFLSRDIFSSDFCRWVEYLSSIYWNSENKEPPYYLSHLKSDIVGIPAIRPFVANIYSQAKASGFDENKDQAAIIFKNLMSNSLSFVLKVFPEAGKYIELNPLFKPFVNHMNAQFGPEIVAAYFESVWDSRAYEFGIVAAGRCFTKKALLPFDAKMLKSGRLTSSKLRPTSVLKAAEMLKKQLSDESSNQIAKALTSQYVAGSKRYKKYKSNFPIVNDLPKIVNILPRIGYPSSSGPALSMGSFIIELITVKLIVHNPFLVLSVITTSVENEISDKFNVSPVFTKFSLFSEVVKNVRIEDAKRERRDGIAYFETAVPILYLIDFARVLICDIAKYYSEKKDGKNLNIVGRLGGMILDDIVQSTSNCCFAKSELPEPENLYDLLILEAAECVGDEMIVRGYQELLTTLMDLNDPYLQTLSRQIYSNKWKMRWKVSKTSD